MDIINPSSISSENNFDNSLDNSQLEFDFSLCHGYQYWYRC